MVTIAWTALRGAVFSACASAAAGWLDAGAEAAAGMAVVVAASVGTDVGVGAGGCSHALVSMASSLASVRTGKEVLTLSSATSIGVAPSVAAAEVAGA